MIKKMLTITVLCTMITGSAISAEEPKKIRIFWAGTSSTTKSFILTTNDLINSTGNFKVVSSEKETAGYSSLTALFKPENEKKWLDKNIPKIQKGNYDYVVLQMLYRFLTLTPEDQKHLFSEVLPRVVKKIRATGAEVVLFDKYVYLHNMNNAEVSQKVRDWSHYSRYPDSERLFYLLSIMFGKYAKIDRMSFGGLANNHLWKQKRFIDMKCLFNEGHPGPLGEYISACGISNAITGISPVGNPMRKIHMAGHQLGLFEKEKDDKVFYDKYKKRIKDGFFIMTDEEADILQKTAMKYHLEYTVMLKKNISDDNVFKKTLKDIDAIHVEMDKFDEYGLPLEIVNGVYRKIRAQYPFYGCPDCLKKEFLKNALSEILSPPRGFYKTVTIRFRKHPDEHKIAKEIMEKWKKYWDDNNSKYRDDLIVRFLKYSVPCSDPAETSRLAEVKKFINMIYSLPGYIAMYDYVDNKQKPLVKLQFKKELSPAFYAYNENQKRNQDKIKGWNCYLDILRNPQLMDDIINANFSNDSWLVVDKVFQKRISK